MDETRPNEAGAAASFWIVDRSRPGLRPHFRIVDRLNLVRAFLREERNRRHAI